jgi:coproporphyrinogen III oxidase-like Fe-S oxidoreductase
MPGSESKRDPLMATAAAKSPRPGAGRSPQRRAALLESLRLSLSRDTALYVNYPFCRSLCRYCIFKLLAFEPGQSEAYLAHQVREVDHYARGLGGFKFRYLHVGGGTPNLVPAGRLFPLFAPLVDFGRTDQVVVEVRPQADLADWLPEARRFGLTKVLLGVQSLDERILALEHRSMTRSLIEGCMATLRDSGLLWSVDLLLGFRDEARLERDPLAELRAVLAFRPSGVHLYRMRSERRNRFYNGEAPADERLVFWDRHASPSGAAPLVDELEAAGYQRVGDEWCLPKALDHSRYSLCHHDGLGAQPEVVGLGLGARTDTRAGWWSTARKLSDYVAALDRGDLPIRVRVDYRRTNLYAVSQVRKEIRLMQRIDLDKFCAAAALTPGERAELDRALAHARERGAKFVVYDGTLQVGGADYTLFLRSLDEYMDERCRGEAAGRVLG